VRVRLNLPTPPVIIDGRIFSGSIQKVRNGDRGTMAAVGVSFGKARIVALVASFLLALTQMALSQPPAATSHRVCVYSLDMPTSGERLCITRETYGRDLCIAIDHFAGALCGVLLQLRCCHLKPRVWTRPKRTQVL